MSTNKKIDRALNGPGVVEIVFSILLSLTLGVALGALHLVFKPVEMVTKPVEIAAPDTVYFVEGSSNGSKVRQWTRKRQLLAGGGPVEVVFNEDELNAWVTSATPKPPAAGAAQAVTSIVQPERVNFRIQEGVLQLGVIGKLSALGFEQKMVIQTRGTFEAGANGFTFKPAALYIGSLPLQLVPGLPEYFIKKILASQELPEDIQATWSKLSLVAVEGSSLRLVLP